MSIIIYDGRKSCYILFYRIDDSSSWSHFWLLDNNYDFPTIHNRYLLFPSRTCSTFFHRPAKYPERGHFSHYSRCFHSRERCNPHGNWYHGGCRFFFTRNHPDRSAYTNGHSIILLSAHPEMTIFVQNQVEDPVLVAGACEKNNRRYIFNIPIRNQEPEQENSAPIVQEDRDHTEAFSCNNSYLSAQSMHETH